MARNIFKKIKNSYCQVNLTTLKIQISLITCWTKWASLSLHTCKHKSYLFKKKKLEETFTPCQPARSPTARRKSDEREISVSDKLEFGETRMAEEAPPATVNTSAVVSMCFTWGDFYCSIFHDKQANLTFIQLEVAATRKFEWLWRLDTGSLNGLIFLFNKIVKQKLGWFIWSILDDYFHLYPKIMRPYNGVCPLSVVFNQTDLYICKAL